jgi:FKBP-type peptidyl-prolyl cis-trans isomerase
MPADLLNLCRSGVGPTDVGPTGFHGGGPCAVILVGLCVLLSACDSQARRGPNAIDPDAPSEFTTTDSGLEYRILRRSDGAKPKSDDYVTVDYSGWLDDQTVFDSSYERRQPATFRLSEVIPGWTEGLQYVAEGGMIELRIPPELAYADRGSPPRIPPDATLHFKVELHEIQ